MDGWVINISDPTRTQAADRAQVPCFYLPDGPVFEVWLWHRGINRWVVMSTEPDPAWAAQGVLSFLPGDVTGLRRMIAAIQRVVGG